MKRISYNTIRKQSVIEGINNGDIDTPITTGDTFEMANVEITLIVEMDTIDTFVLYFKAGDKKILVPGEMYEQFQKYVIEEIEERQ